MDPEKSKAEADLKRKMTRLRFGPRLARSLRKRQVGLVHGDNYFIAEYFGARFLVQRGDFVAREIALKNFEQYQIENFINSCERVKPELFIDIGANIGLYSCIALSRNLVPRAALFEPSSRTAIHLRANLLINGLLDRAEVHQVAAGRKRGRLKLEAGPASNSGQSRVVEGGEGDSIEVLPLDEIFNFSGKTLAVKMDIERYELEALAGMQRLLRDNRGFVQIEALDTRDEVIEVMKGCGYKMVADFYWDLFFEKP